MPPIIPGWIFCLSLSLPPSQAEQDDGEWEALSVPYVSSLLFFTPHALPCSEWDAPTGYNPSQTAPGRVLPMGCSASKAAPAWLLSIGTSPSGSKGSTVGSLWGHRTDFRTQNFVLNPFWIYSGMMDSSLAFHMDGISNNEFCSWSKSRRTLVQLF